MSGEQHTKIFWHCHPNPKTVSELKVAVETGEDMGQFSAGPINKAIPSFRKSLTEYVNGDGKHSGHSSLLKLMVSALSWIAEIIFDNMTTVRVPWLKAA